MFTGTSVQEINRQIMMGPGTNKQLKMEVGPWAALEEATKTWLAPARARGWSLVRIAAADHFRAAHLRQAAPRPRPRGPHIACESRVVAWPTGPTPAAPSATQTGRAGPAPTEGCSPLPVRYGPNSD
jgi:hypothetical protein